ncbi:MAG TPA: hypothetical protein PL131_05810 [Methylotenera sp.]|nr:hypothetical protein [Methylotenera sp.]HPH05371.1 hypothetical protein [Methylotenera sp.]HPN01297.1 hypothetical protein [Methylotenera sp.]
MKTLFRRLLVLFAVLASNAFAEIAMPALQQSGEITFVTGGIAEEAELMRNVAKDYTLEIVLVQRLDNREYFLADVNIQIFDATQQLVLETNTEGPYLYANLPAGRYVIVATFNGETKQQKMQVTTKKHQKVVFWWLSNEPLQLEETLE